MPPDVKLDPADGFPEVDDPLPAGTSPTAPEEAPGVPVNLVAVVPRAGMPVPVAVAVGCIAGTAFALLVVGVAASIPLIVDVDEQLHAWILAHRGATDLTVARAVTWGGATVVALPTLAVLGALAPRGRRGARSRLGSGALLAGITSLGVYCGLAINALVDRQRPDLADWAGDAGGPAFPSGHTTAATLFAAAGAWALLGAVSREKVLARRLIVCCAVAWAVVVGWSRAWLGVHWPVDVLGGWLFASAWSALAYAALSVARAHRARRAARSVDTPQR